MDRISHEGLHAAQGRQPLAPRAGRLVAKAAISSVPWLVIAGLLWAGLFIKPSPVGGSVQPPVRERRDHYFGLAVVAPGQVWMAGSSGKIVAVDSAGKMSRLPTPTSETLQDLAVWDAKHAVAVGNNGVIIVSTDGGRSWKSAVGVPRSEVANKLNRVTVGEGMAVASGEMGALLASRDGGTTWTRLRAEEDVAWNDVALPGGGRICVVGEFGRVIVSDDSGVTWKAITTPVTSSLMAVAFRDARHGVAVGLEGVVLTTGDAGESWQQVPVGVGEHLFDVAWDEGHKRWIGTGDLGRWIRADGEALKWQNGRLDARDLSWHTRLVPAGDSVWLSGANVGRWDGSRWTPLNGL